MAQMILNTAEKRRFDFFRMPWHDGCISRHSYLRNGGAKYKPAWPESCEYGLRGHGEVQEPRGSRGKR
ncbi:MAG: hypothetical protein CMF59_12225 [Leptospiraceae bacterium]|nr:hypothetical protein [Leptospiraceae bacterium]